MTLLGDINLYEDEDEELKDTKYTYGIYKKEDKNDLSLPKCFIFSALLHPVVVGIIWLSIFILALLGITFSIFEKPQQKPQHCPKSGPFGGAGALSGAEWSFSRRAAFK